jgi:hypothetical protein
MATGTDAQSNRHFMSIVDFNDGKNAVLHCAKTIYFRLEKKVATFFIEFIL